VTFDQGDNLGDLSLHIGRAVAVWSSAIMTAREGEMRRMLSAWVSELEPCAAYVSDNSAPGVSLVGLIVAGDQLVEGMPPIVVAAAPGTP
jgi:hypothetical protein